MGSAKLDQVQSAHSRVLGRQSGKALAASDPERLIEIGRLVTSLFAVIAIYLDPTRPARFLHVSELVLGFYVLFAVLMVLLPTRQPIDSKTHIISHGVDIVVLGGLSFLTDELTSPFFAFLPFILLATTMRWGLPGAIFGAIALEAVLVVVGWPDLRDGDSELNILIMRSAYFIVAAAMLGYFGASRDGSLYRLARLAAWPSDGVTSDRKLWMQSILQHAAEVLGEPRLLVIWQDQEEPQGTLAHWNGRKLELFDIADPDFWENHNLEISDWASGPLQVAQVESLLRSLPQLDQKNLKPPRKAYSAGFSGFRYKGRLFVLDPGCGVQESASVTDIIAARIGSDLERFELMRHIAVTARSQERVRLARDLHDSILQDLTATGLKLKAVGARVPDEAKSGLAMVSALLLEQQRRIRMFVQQVNSTERTHQAPSSGHILETVETLSNQWNCEIQLQAEPQDIRLSSQMSAQVAQLLSEATANAVRHGGATKIDVTVVCHENELALTVDDNGSGIARDGADAGLKPMSLASRVADLGGYLSIIRHAPGLAMHIRLPIAGAA